MENSILIETLKSLEADEMMSFGKFVRSPYFNESVKLTGLFEILKKYYPHFKSRSFTKEKIHRKLYPGKKYNDETMRKLFSDLQRLAEEYLSYSELDKKFIFEKKVYLLNSLRSRNLDKKFTQGMKSLHEEYTPLQNIGDDYFYRNLDLTKLELGHIIGRGKAGKYDIYDELRSNFDERSKYLIYYSLIQVYKSAQDLLALSQRYNFNFRETLIYKFLNSFKSNDFMKELSLTDPSMYPVIAIYYLNFTIYSGSDKDDSHYYVLKELVLKYMSVFTLFERNNLMVFLENCCLEKIKEGKKNFHLEIHEVYKIILSGGLYMFREGDSMDTGRFLRIVNNSIALKKYDWTEKFIKDYKEKLSDEVKDDVIGYSLAVLNFNRSDYDKAIELASKVKFTSYILKFQTQILQLKSCFELGYIEEILYQLDSYKRTLKKDTTAPKDAKEKFQNFMMLLNKMVKVSLSEQPGRLNEITGLIKELDETKALYDKQWLEEKLTKLKTAQ
jgi:hypothetical protein